MEGNKDEALKCLEIAKQSLQSGDQTRALKFLAKARRLYPSIAVDDQLSYLDSSGSEKPAADRGSQGDRGPRLPARRRVSANGSSASSSSAASYTEEQVTIVREIKRKKNFYEILGLEKSCSAEDVKKAYKKLSLKVHPDKNKAPGAEDVFKMVSKAFQCLSNEESRRKYDVSGSDEAVYETQTRAHRRGGGGQGFNGFYHDGDFDADEIFRNFFYGGMNPSATTQFGGFSFGPGGVGVRMGGNQGVSNNGSFRTLLQVLPVLLILLMSFLPTQQPIFSLSRSYPYQYQLATERGVNYFVKSGRFDQEYPLGSTERVELEKQVDGEYYRIISHNCRVEMSQIHWGRREMPSCDAVKTFQATTA